jgi:hypothetical protein
VACLDAPSSPRNQAPFIDEAGRRRGVRRLPVRFRFVDSMILNVEERWTCLIY